MAMCREASIWIDNVIAQLEMRVENLHLILRSKRQIAICARSASTRTEIAARLISVRDIAVHRHEIPRATEGHTREPVACEKVRRGG